MSGNEWKFQVKLAYMSR